MNGVIGIVTGMRIYRIIYYFNSPSEHKLICGDCGEKVKTNNEDDDIIFCYKIKQS